MRFAPQQRALFRHLDLQKWSGPLGCFIHFDLEMCFAPQRRALFRHLDLQKWSEPLVFCAAGGGSIPRWSASKPWKCASCHKGVHFFDIQTDHTHHTYPTYHTTPPPHHRGEGDSTMADP